MTHRHKCPKCGMVWEHEDSCAGNKEAHDCPRVGCDGRQSWKMWPEEEGEAKINNTNPSCARDGYDQLLQAISSLMV